MIRLQLDDRQWSKVAAILRAGRKAGRPGKDDRKFVEGVLWWRRTGVPWPCNGSRAEKLPYDKELYKARSEIECTFNFLKQARRFATRYEKTLRNYVAVVAIGCALLWRSEFRDARRDYVNTSVSRLTKAEIYKTRISSRRCNGTSVSP